MRWASTVMIAVFFMTAPANGATISIVNQVEGFLGSNKAQVTTAHNGTTQLNYDATGVDKLVVAIGTESGFNNNAVTSVNVQFNGVPMTLAVQENTHSGGWDGGIAALFYLDNPFQGSGNFSVSATTTGGGLNGGHVSILGLADTLPGVGNTGASWHTQASAGNVSTSLTTSASNSLVIGMVENSGRNNGAGTPNTVAPLTLSNNGFWGSQWGSAASGYQYVAGSGTSVTPTFSTNAGGNIHVVAAEFLVVPESSTFALLGLAGLMLAGFAIRRARLKS